MICVISTASAHAEVPVTILHSVAGVPTSFATGQQRLTEPTIKLPLYWPSPQSRSASRGAFFASILSDGNGTILGRTREIGIPTDEDDVTYEANWAGFQIAALPEPATVVLAALGMFGLVVLRCRARLYSSAIRLSNSAFREKHLCAGLTICTTSFIVAALTSAARGELPDTILHNFAGGTNDGYWPTALTMSGTKLYGITQEGGVADFGPAGVAYSLDITNNAFSLLHSFAGGASDGATPTGRLTLAGSMLFGTTYQGGSSGLGTIYSLNTTNNGLTILHSFAGGSSDGYHPSAGLTLSGATLYGVTESGAVFGLNTNTNVISILHKFTGGLSDGAFPEGELTLSGSTLYGTASNGGALNKGVLFSLDTTTDAFTVLHSFDGNPRTGLTLSGTKLYGTTPGGGTLSNGTVFSFDTANSEFTVLHSFAGGPGDGRDPEAGLILSGSMLYGTTESGGVLSPGGMPSHGTVFSLDTSGNNYTLLHSFAGGPDDGAAPSAGLILSGSTLYGTTFYGGTAGDGTVFAIQIPEPSTFVLAAVCTLGLMAARCHWLLHFGSHDSPRHVALERTHETTYL